MKKALSLTIAILLTAALTGCAAQEDTMSSTPENSKAAVADFYYTTENINYDAFYQRYRFYVEDGSRLFFHEHRERPGEYGPCTEADTTATGTVELTDEQWEKFMEFVSAGTVAKAKESTESGGSGPWMFIYFEDNETQHSFTLDAATQAEFVSFCETLAAK